MSRLRSRSFKIAEFTIASGFFFEYRSTGLFETNFLYLAHFSHLVILTGPLSTLYRAFFAATSPSLAAIPIRDGLGTSWSITLPLDASPPAAIATHAPAPGSCASPSPTPSPTIPRTARPALPLSSASLPAAPSAASASRRSPTKPQGPFFPSHYLYYLHNRI